MVFYGPERGLSQREHDIKDEIKKIDDEMYRMWMENRSPSDALWDEQMRLMQEQRKLRRERDSKFYVMGKVAGEIPEMNKAKEKATEQPKTSEIQSAKREFGVETEKRKYANVIRVKDLVCGNTNDCVETQVEVTLEEPRQEDDESASGNLVTNDFELTVDTAARLSDSGERGVNAIGEGVLSWIRQVTGRIFNSVCEYMKMALPVLLLQ